MELLIPTNKVPFTLLVDAKTRSPEILKIIAKDSRKPQTYYYNRIIKVNGERTINLKMPQSPPILDLKIFNVASPDLVSQVDPSLSFSDIKAVPLKENPIWLSKQDREFIEFAQWFSENASILTSGKNMPHIYRSTNGNFEIDYFDVIKDRKSKIPVKTPARIGHISGTIEISKKHFLHYSIPMRMIILLHEYSHKFKNPKQGFDITNEYASDVNALRMFLSLGYSEVEGIYAFHKTFKISDSKVNKIRMMIIKDFVRKFNRGEFSNITTDYVRIN